MFVVAFEVEPRADLWDEYLHVAGTLRPQLESIDGFIDNTRFRCARAPGRLLSLSTWRDEKALIRWRTQAAHHELGQQRGRSEIFSDYRLRVAEVTVDNQPPAGFPLRQSRYDETETGTAKAITLIEPIGASPPDTLPVIGDRDGLIDAERYDPVLPPHHPIRPRSLVCRVAASRARPCAVRAPWPASTRAGPSSPEWGGSRCERVACGLPCSGSCSRARALPGAHAVVVVVVATTSAASIRSRKSTQVNCPRACSRSPSTHA